MPLIGLFHGSFFSPFLLSHIPPAVADAMIGEYVAQPYTALLETDASKRFTKNIESKYGFMAEDEDFGPYLGILTIIKGLEASGGDATPEVLRRAILGLNIETPAGPLKFEQDKRCGIMNVYITKVDKIDGKYVLVPVHTYEDVTSDGL